MNLSYLSFLSFLLAKIPQNMDYIFITALNHFYHYHLNEIRQYIILTKELSFCIAYFHHFSSSIYLISFSISIIVLPFEGTYSGMFNSNHNSVNLLIAVNEFCTSYNSTLRSSFSLTL